MGEVGRIDLAETRIVPGKAQNKPSSQVATSLCVRPQRLNGTIKHVGSPRVFPA